ncbi:DedA family protein [Georgenia sp. Z1344]|uniref:DedA family protein n=1 Tax=Georgenia sp. Z1344 TaxID=3416706 RepID=UPI003CF9A1D5
MGDVLALVDAVQDWMVDLAASPWVLVIVLAGCIVDGFFPAAPSEGVVIAAAALTAHGEGPHIYLLWPAAAVGAFVGDQIAYRIGMAIPLHRIPVLNRGRGAKVVAGARRTLGRRGAALILAARFIPFGRVAVNMTAGAVDYPRTRFVLLSGIAAIVWATYAVALGFGAGAAIKEHPLLGVVLGVVGGFLLGILLERVLGWAQGRFLPQLGLDDEEEDEHDDDEHDAAATAAPADRVGGADGEPDTDPESDSDTEGQVA